MSDNRPEEYLIDNRLAEFTDQVLNAEAGEPLPQMSQQDDLGRLQRVVLLLKRAGPGGSPAVGFSARLWAALQSEWTLGGPKAQAAEPRKLRGRSKAWFARLGAARRGWGLAAAALAVLLLVAVVALPETGPLAGAAGTNFPWPVLEVFAGVVALGLLIWLLRKKE